LMMGVEKSENAQRCAKQTHSRIKNAADTCEFNPSTV